MIRNVSVGVDVIVRCCCVSACVKPLIDWQLGRDLTSLEKKQKRIEQNRNKYMFNFLKCKTSTFLDMQCFICELSKFKCCFMMMFC